jgi:dihydroflavonol-4-reductase
MKALVTGGSGLIGANLVRELLAAGHEVRALVRPSSNTAALRSLPVELAAGDVRDMDAVARAMAGCELVFHTAVQFAYGSQAHEALEPVAVSGTTNLVSACAAAGVRRIVVTSSSVVFGYSAAPVARGEDAGIGIDAGDPPYVVAKVRQHERALELARDLGVEVVLACPTMCMGALGATLGPSNAVVAGYLGDPWRRTLPGGCNVVSARDVARGHVDIALRGEPGQQYLLGSENLEWSGLHALVAELGGVPPPKMRLNLSTSYLLAAAEELRARIKGQSPIITREQATMLGRYYWYDHSRATALGYVPRPARAAIADAIAWLSAGSHIARETRAGMHLHADVFAARLELERREQEFSSRTLVHAV